MPYNTLCKDAQLVTAADFSAGESAEVLAEGFNINHIMLITTSGHQWTDH